MNYFAYIKGKTHSYYLNCITPGFNLFDIIQKINFSKDAKQIFFDKEHFLKSESSLQRAIFKQFKSKINSYTHLTDSVQIDSDLSDCLSVIQDVLRMNFEITNNNFEATVIDILRNIKTISNISLNHKLPKPFKNSFVNNGGCKDFKVFFLYRDIPFEIQFHNKESELMNLNTHGIYEVYRSMSDGVEEKEMLREDRDKLFSTIQSPSFDDKKIMKKAFDYEA